MSTLSRLVAFVQSAAAVPVGPAPGDDLPRWLALAQAHDADLHALMRCVIERPTSYCFGELEIFPGIFTRRPWKAGVASDNEICLAKNGGGDLYLWDAVTGRVRFVVHDEDWVTRRGWRSASAMLDGVFYSSLEAIEPDDVDQLASGPDDYLARLRFAIEIAGPDVLQDETRAAMVAAGLV